MITTVTPETIADLAVDALRCETDLTPKPGLVDRRGSGAHTDMDAALLHVSAAALRPALVECAMAAAELGVGPQLRAALGAIGRAGEAEMMRATGGVNTHRGALWALGLLSAGSALGRTSADAVQVAARLARIPDPAAVDTTSHGALARRRYGVGGAAAQAQAGFPHVRLHALPALRAARSAGADETSARIDALLALMARVDDTCVLHRDGWAGLRAVQCGARQVLDAGGHRTSEGRRRFIALDDMCLVRRISPGGSADLLSVTLFLDALDEGTSPCKR